MVELLRRGLTELGLDAGGAEELARFAALVLRKNEVMNLTAITDETAFAQLHLLDSAALLPLADFAGRRVVDVGTGAGFPGVPLRILCPSVSLTLLDSLGKRVDFLREACGALALHDVSCVHARAEEFARAERETYDIAVSRAVAALPVLCELCLPLVRVGGRFLAMKSVDSDAELESAAHAIRTLGARVARVVDYTVPTAGVTHRMIEIEKTAPTGAKYPRAFARIKKEPL